MSSGVVPKDTHSIRGKSKGFRFKQFTIYDSQCSHKVGTDGTLLGAWTTLENAKHILDIGTGSGLIAIMAAQRTREQSSVEAIEVSQPDCEQALENIRRSPWPDKIKIYHTSLQKFHSAQKFDCIISNPPYFNNSYKPPNESRITPRHTDTLSFEELITHSRRLLKDTGRLNVVMPYAEGLQFIELAKQQGFYITRQWSFLTRQEKPIERWLLEFSLESLEVETGEILLYSKGGEWSDGYKELTKEFYLKC
jgi:tRNA1Val (adenine37-N6)-methyltransferase